MPQNIEGDGEAIVARCHCGDVTVALPHRPVEITKCNCSLCRKTGFLGIYYAPADVTATGPVDGYVRDDLDEACLTNWHCRRCGCLTHWTGLGVYAERKIGVNARMLDPAVIDGLPVKEVDGASW
jgi:hypothetical protein